MQRNQTHMNFWMNIILSDLLWFWMLHSSAWIEICPYELDWSKVLASMHNYPRHPARPLVSVVAVKGFGGRKSFLHAAAVLIHLLSDMCSPPNVEGAGLIQSWQSYTCLVSTNFHFPADLGHLRLHRIPKELLHLCTTALTNLIWIQDSAGYFWVRRRDILKLSTHTE